MELVNPGLGLIFWMTLAFGAVFYILKKFAWPIIIQALKDRERHIEEALQAADRAHEEMKKMQLDNEALLKKAKEERDQIMQEARKLRDKMLEESRIKANEEADRIVENAKVRIELPKYQSKLPRWCCAKR
jgi:F-type H+-transporting ATPase subunit b